MTVVKEGLCAAVWALLFRWRVDAHLPGWEDVSFATVHFAPVPCSLTAVSIHVGVFAGWQIVPLLNALGSSLTSLELRDGLLAEAEKLYFRTVQFSALTSLKLDGGSSPGDVPQKPHFWALLSHHASQLLSLKIAGPIAELTETAPQLPCLTSLLLLHDALTPPDLAHLVWQCPQLASLELLDAALSRLEVLNLQGLQAIHTIHNCSGQALLISQPSVKEVHTSPIFPSLAMNRIPPSYASRVKSLHLVFDDGDDESWLAHALAMYSATLRHLHLGEPHYPLELIPPLLTSPLAVLQTLTIVDHGLTFDELEVCITTFVQHCPRLKFIKFSLPESSGNALHSLLSTIGRMGIPQVAVCVPDWSRYEELSQQV